MSNALKNQLLNQLTGYFSNDLSQKAAIRNSFEGIRLDGQPEFVPDLFQRKSIHDDDYVIFRAFQDPNSIILDVGANWGYSVSSMRCVGTKSKIISFEAIPLYESCLQAVKAQSNDDYEFFLIPLGASTEKKRFVIPVVNDTALTALTTADDTPHIASMAENIFNYFMQYMDTSAPPSLTFCEFERMTSRLDDVVVDQQGSFNFPVAAIKVDVEGLEYDVMRGAEELLSVHRPLVMLENPDVETVKQFMLDQGYVLAQREGQTMHIVERFSDVSNGFFLHTSRLAEYKQLGILLD